MAKHIYTGTGAPAFTPAGVGHHYIDTASKAAYISVGTSSSADWETSDAAAVESLLDTHIADVANPHSVTKTQVGLGNADNTSDVDKPVSTAQGVAIGLKKDDSMSTNKMLGRGTAGTGVIEEITLGTNLSLTGTTLNASGGGSWGTISGTLNTQVDLANELTNLVDGDGAYYFTSAASDLGAGRLEMTKAISAGGGASESFTGVTNAQYLSSFCTVSGFPNVDHLPAGPLSFNCYATQTAGTQVCKLYAEFYVREVGGTEYLLGTTPVTEALTGVSTNFKAHTTMGPYRTMNLTDRLLIRIRAEVTGVGTAPNVELRFQGTEMSRTKFPCEPVAPSVAWGAITGTLSAQTDLDTALGTKQDDISASNNQLIYQNGSGTIEGLPGIFKDTTSGGLDIGLTQNPNAGSGNISIHDNSINVNPLANTPNETYTLQNNQISIDTDDDGFSIGTAGTAVKMLSNYVSAQNKSDMGEVNFIINNFNLGNGTDAIDVNGWSYSNGFGTVNANVNISGPMQGYGYQPNVNASATIGTGEYTNAFYDSSNISCASPGHTSFNASPVIASINNGNNYTAFNTSPSITTFTGNAGCIGLSVTGNLGTFNANGYFHGVNVNPTITSARYAAGLNVTMDNVTPYAGVNASVTIQDLTFEFNQPGSFNNSYTMEFTTGATAGSEVVTILGNAITIQIENGVSTATQVKAACDATPSFLSSVTTTITGTASNAQVADGPDSFAGGIDAGRALAAYLDGDVEITGALSFGGALSIGKLSAFASQTMVDGGGTPASIHSLITGPTVGDNITLTSADTIAVNTAALISIGTNSTVATSFIGVAALGLPAVLTMATGSTIDRVYGALFALSLDASATGGTADEVGLCRAVAIPNGVTTVNNLYGYLFDLPFGDPGTKTFGFYDRPGKNNYFNGTLLIGGTPGSDDTVTNSSIGLEIKSTTKTFMNARMTTSERNALTAVNGLQIYNSTTDKLQVYAGGSWVDLH